MSRWMKLKVTRTKAQEAAEAALYASEEFRSLLFKMAILQQDNLALRLKIEQYERDILLRAEKRRMAQQKRRAKKAAKEGKSATLVIA